MPYMSSRDLIVMGAPGLAIADNAQAKLAPARFSTESEDYYIRAINHSHPRNKGRSEFAYLTSSSLDSSPTEFSRTRLERVTASRPGSYVLAKIGHPKRYSSK